MWWGLAHDRVLTSCSVGHRHGLWCGLRKSVSQLVFTFFPRTTRSDKHVCFFIFSLCFASRLVPNCPFAGPGKIFSECNAPLCAVRTIPSARRRSRNINSFRMFAGVLQLAVGKPSGDGDSRFMNAGFLELDNGKRRIHEHLHSLGRSGVMVITPSGQRLVHLLQATCHRLRSRHEFSSETMCCFCFLDPT